MNKKENEHDENEEKETLEELTQKMNDLMKEVQTLKKERAKESPSSSTVTPSLETTIEESLKVVEDLPQQIGKSLEELGLFKEIFSPPLTKNERKDRIQERKEKIQEKTEKIKSKTQKFADAMKKKIGSEIQKELAQEGLIDTKVENDIHMPQELEKRTDTLQEAIDEIVKKIVSKSRKELKTSIEEAIETFDTGRIADLLSILASSERLAILKFLHEEGRYYTDIGEQVDLGPSSLKFHLGKLKEADLINQERARGKYFITEKGKSALRLIAFLEMILLPSKSPPGSYEESS